MPRVAVCLLPALRVQLPTYHLRQRKCHSTARAKSPDIWKIVGLKHQPLTHREWRKVHLWTVLTVNFTDLSRNALTATQLWSQIPMTPHHHCPVHFSLLLVTATYAILSSIFARFWNHHNNNNNHVMQTRNHDVDFDARRVANKLNTRQVKRQQNSWAAKTRTPTLLAQFTIDGWFLPR